ncbi:MAG: Bug family tripartite tricarboxylate transporter substrate binding protein [Burkholderiales bacterium]
MTQISGLMVGLLALLIVGSPAAQTTYPEKPIRMVVGFPAGGQLDTVARLLGPKFAEAWGKPVLIDNVTGAAGNIAADRVAKAAPDGYTLGLLGSPQLVINPSLTKLSYDPVKDYAPISQVTASPFMLVVHNAVPAKSVKELVALAKAEPGGLTFASSGSGSATHLAAELLKSAAGLDIRHIPYKGVAASMPDLLGARVTMTFGPTGVVSPLASEGKLRALAVTSIRRSSAAPELPTIAESGYPGFEVTSLIGLLAPAKTPAMIVGKLHLETVKALAHPDVRAKLADLGLEGIGSSPDEFAAVIKSEIPKWAKVIKEAGIKAD